jgi:uncharacterized protein YqeY
MTLYEQIRNDLKEDMKSRGKYKLAALRVIIGEFSRLNLKAGEVPTDEQIITILRRLQKNEKTLIKAAKLEDTMFLQVVESYLPQMMSEEEISKFISSNIDVGSFKNIMQAMGPIMKELKGKADGNTVKSVLEKMK